MLEQLLLNQVLGRLVMTRPSVVPLANKRLPFTKEQLKEWEESEESNDDMAAFETAQNTIIEHIASGKSISTLLSLEEGEILGWDKIGKLRGELSDIYWLYKAYANVMWVAIDTQDDYDDVPIDPECSIIGKESTVLFKLMESEEAVFHVDAPVSDWLLRAQKLVKLLNDCVMKQQQHIKDVAIAQEAVFDQMDEALDLLGQLAQKFTSTTN
jgi:hypothetical protein